MGWRQFVNIGGLCFLTLFCYFLYHIYLWLFQTFLTLAAGAGSGLVFDVAGFIGVY
jgi:hypothetical protein